MTRRIAECINAWYAESAKGVRDTDTNSKYFAFKRVVFRLAQQARQAYREGNFSLVLARFDQVVGMATDEDFPIPVACYIGLLLLQKEQMQLDRGHYSRPKYDHIGSKTHD